MKNTKIFFYINLAVVITSVLGCAKPGDSAKLGLAPAVPAPPRVDLVDEPLGNYESDSCFLDQMKTMERKAYYYARATFTFNADRSAVARYTYFRDENCRVKMNFPESNETVSFSSFSADKKVGDVRILTLQKPKGTIRNPRLYIPLAKTETGFLFSLDYLASASAGPFVTLPDAGVLLDFENNPAGHAVHFSKK